jgi:hypothetical protein
MTDQYTQGQLFYTEEEVITKINNSVQQALAGTLSAEYCDNAVQRGKDNLTQRLMENTHHAIKESVDDYTIDRDTAVTLYNRIADYNEWTNIRSFARKFTVEVVYNGSSVGEFTVEADNEEAAQAEVSENLELTDSTISLSLSYGDQTCEGEVYVDTWTIADDLEFNVEEQG